MTSRTFLSMTLLPAALVTLLTPERAAAHLRLEEPAPRHDETSLKEGPCGAGPTDARSTDPARITTLPAGSTITVRWVETIDHDPAHYRIAFGRTGQSEFVDPAGYDDIGTAAPILLDGIPDADAGGNQEYSVEVTLPSEPCDACTLQVIQVMHDKPPWGPGGGDDIYYQCADLVLTADGGTGEGGAPPITPPNPGSPPTSSGGALGTGGVLGAPEGPGATTGGAAPTNDAPSSPSTSGCSTTSRSPSARFLGSLFLLALSLASWARRRSATSPSS